jgi:hypothetical protein
MTTSDLPLDGGEASLPHAGWRKKRQGWTAAASNLPTSDAPPDDRPHDRDAAGGVLARVGASGADVYEACYGSAGELPGAEALGCRTVQQVINGLGRTCRATVGDPATCATIDGRTIDPTPRRRLRGHLGTARWRSSTGSTTTCRSNRSCGRTPTTATTPRRTRRSAASIPTTSTRSPFSWGCGSARAGCGRAFTRRAPGQRPARCRCGAGTSAEARDPPAPQASPPLGGQSPESRCGSAASPG